MHYAALVSFIVRSNQRVSQTAFLEPFRKKICACGAMGYESFVNLVRHSVIR